jgi:hypothetical protein
MEVTFKWSLSYRDEVEYKVFGSPVARSLEVYRCNHPSMMEYIRSDFNGDAAEFERIVIARQGGVIIRYSDQASYPRWTPELYQAFVSWLGSDYERHKENWRVKCLQYGWEFEFEPAPAVPRPIYYNFELHTYVTEPWFAGDRAAA